MCNDAFDMRLNTARMGGCSGRLSVSTTGDRLPRPWKVQPVAGVMGRMVGIAGCGTGWKIALGEDAGEQWEQPGAILYEQSLHVQRLSVTICSNSVA